MRRSEHRFVSSEVELQASRLGAAVREGRIARNSTLEAMASRARMSAVTWMRIERGEVSVSMSSWMSALELTGVLDTIARAITPREERAAPRQRVRTPRGSDNDFDF
jgi:transcriptional regulator with XRE-family HTH domain